MLYPFIVNDPGEGAQAKRRDGAVIIDHLTPPLTRAESYGPLRELEALVDEYYERRQLDPRRCHHLEARDPRPRAGQRPRPPIAASPREDGTMRRSAKLDNHLCELKELQIRDGLHMFGAAPEGGAAATDLLVALAAQLPRGPRCEGAHGLAAPTRWPRDLGLDGFRSARRARWRTPWTGRGRRCVASRSDDRVPGGSAGDTLETAGSRWRRDLVAGAPCVAEPRAGRGRRAVLDYIDAERLAPPRRRPAATGARSRGLLRGLAGRFVPPGPSGAPTRGRPDVLPTGRNFYSVDTRAVPTRDGLGARAGSRRALVLERHRQDHGG